MKQDKKYLEKDIKKHKPRLVMPIFNTVIGIAFIVFMIDITIHNDIEIIYLILVIFLMIIFIGGTWFNSFFLRKKNQYLTKDFEEETRILFEAVKELKKGKYIDATTKVLFDISDIYTPFEKVRYDVSKKAFLPKYPYTIFINMGPTCAGLVVDYNTLDVIGFSGVSPSSIWIKKRIKLPTYRQGSLKLNLNGYQKVNKLTLKILNQTDSYYDSKNNIIAIGDIKQTVLDENIQICENVIVSLYDQEVKCVYILVDSNLFDK